MILYRIHTTSVILFSCVRGTRMTDGDNFCENCAVSPFSLTRHYRGGVKYKSYRSSRKNKKNFLKNVHAYQSLDFGRNKDVMR